MQPRRRSDRPPSVAMLAIPFVAAAGAVVLAWGHAAIGSPLGAAFAGELWDLAKSLVVMLVAWGPLARYARRANDAALTGAQDRRSLPDGDANSEDDVVDEHDDRRGGARRASRRKRSAPPDPPPPDADRR